MRHLDDATAIAVGPVNVLSDDVAQLTLYFHSRSELVPKLS